MSEFTPAGAANAPAVSFAPETAASTTQRNPAVQRCLQAYEQAWAATMAARHPNKDEARYKARKAAHLAYRDAMPHLHDREAARDFIACIAQGLILEAFTRSEATSLLYAAQTAVNAQPKEQRAPGRPKRSEAFVRSPFHEPLPAKVPASEEGTTPPDCASEPPCLPEN